MKRVEREVNRITSAIIGTALRVLLVVVIAFLVCEGAAKGYRFGYRIFVPPEQIGTAVTKTIVVEEGEPLLEIAENLELTKSKVTVTLMRTRKKLEAFLKEEGYL